MHFIERIFHVVPDGGTGVLEVCLVAILLTLLATRVLIPKLPAAVRFLKKY